MGKLILIILLGFLLAPAVYVMFDDSKPIAIKDAGQSAVQAAQQRDLDAMYGDTAKRKPPKKDAITSWSNH